MAVTRGDRSKSQTCPSEANVSVLSVRALDFFSRGVHNLRPCSRCAHDISVVVLTTLQSVCGHCSRRAYNIAVGVRTGVG